MCNDLDRYTLGKIVALLESMQQLIKENNTYLYRLSLNLKTGAENYKYKNTQADKEPKK